MQASRNSAIRFVKAFIEDWEDKCRKKKDPENEAKFLNKYGGLTLYDQDDKKWVHIRKDKMMFRTNGPKVHRGYALYYNKLGREDDPQDKWEDMHLELACDILLDTNIDGVRIIKPAEDNEDDRCNS